MRIEYLFIILLKLKTKNMETITVHIVYFENKGDAYSKGINIEGYSFSDCCMQFEEMAIGFIFNATIKE